MSRLLFLLLIFSIVFAAGCNLSAFDTTPRVLSYEVSVEPEMSRIRVTGTIDHLRKGSYYFALPRTQGFPPAHFVKYVEFSDANGRLNAEITDLGEWLIATSGPSVSFTYHINLQQELKYQGEAWGGSTTQLEGETAFLNGSLSFMVPLIGNIDAPVNLSWDVPDNWNVVTPWTANVDTMKVPSHYALVNNYYVAYKEGSISSQRIRDVDLNTVWLGEGDINAYPEAAMAIRKVVEAGMDFFGEDSSKEGITLILRDSNAQNRFRASTEANSIEFNFKKGMSFDRIWKNYRDGFLRLLAHEIMHTWDRREVQEATAYLHVREWGPNTCWLREGFTEYFAMLNLYKAGMRDLPTFVNTMQAIAESGKKNNPQGSYSLTNACGLFFENDEALNFIYSGGAALAFQLDLELRNATNGEKTLPALMRGYMSEYRYKEKTIASFVEAWNGYAPAALHNLDARLQSGSSTDLSAQLNTMGLELKPARQGVRYWFVPHQSVFKKHFSL